jgi:dihydrofolate synthase/folylpolyglutamate synthase
MCRDKNITEAVSKIIPLVDSFVTVDGFSDRAEDKHSLAEIIRQQGGKAQAAENNLMTEIDRMKKQNPDGLNLVCGSLFLAAEVAAKLK